MNSVTNRIGKRTLYSGIPVDGTDIHNLFHNDSASFTFRPNHDMEPIFYWRTESRPTRRF